MPPGVDTRHLRLKKTRRTISAKAVVATTSIRPLTRSAGNPTATATSPATTEPVPSASASGQSHMVVSMPAT